MIWRALSALKCRSHSAEDAGITSSSSCAIGQYRIRLFVLFPPIKWIKNISGSLTWQRLSLVCRWVMGESASTHHPYDPSKKLIHLTHWPMTHCLLWWTLLNVTQANTTRHMQAIRYQFVHRAIDRLRACLRGSDRGRQRRGLWKEQKMASTLHDESA